MTEYPLWYIVFCLLAGLVFAFVLYTKNTPWHKALNYGLAGMRFLLVSALCFLLLNPYIRHIENIFEKPLIVFSVDNSASVALGTDSSALRKMLQKLEDFSETLVRAGYQVERRSFSDTHKPRLAFSEISFEEQQSDLAANLHRIEQHYGQRHLTDIILLSDGIYNRGTSPIYANYRTKIHTLGIGDTLAKADLSLQSVYANKIAYAGNKFPIRAEIANTGLVGQKTKVLLLHEGKVIGEKPLSFSQEEDVQAVEFLVAAPKKGLQRYLLKIVALPGEFTKDNNLKNVYVEILESKEQILLVSAAPHPDLKALRSALEKGKNYTLDLLIPGFAPTKEREFLGKQYDLLIFYQLPNLSGAGNKILEKLLKKQTARLFVLGTQSDYARFNQWQTTAQIRLTNRQPDEVTAMFNPAFKRFIFDETARKVIREFPPLYAPFGEYSLSANAETVLFQEVGGVNTARPLLAVSTQGNTKTGVLFGEGCWRWRLQEFATHEKHDTFDALIGKLVQYLSAKSDKRKFRVYPSKTTYADYETVFFETQVYNDIYEPIFGQDITLKLKHESGSEKEFSYVNNRSNTGYAINGLKDGIYHYQAAAVVNSKAKKHIGKFSVQKTGIEALNTQANFSVLRQLATRNGGIFAQSEDMDALLDSLRTHKAAEIIHSEESSMEIIKSPWILAIIAFLACLEWFVRKYKGSY